MDIAQRQSRGPHPPRMVLSGKAPSCAGSTPAVHNQAKADKKTGRNTMTKRKTSKVSIDIYDADGVLCECIGGPMDYEDVKEQLLSIIGNDGIPVIRVHGKHEKVEEQHDHPVAVPRWEQPMTLSIEYQGARFLAPGKYEDVMDAQAEFMETVKCGGG